MPVTTPDIKVANVRRLGGTVELVGETYQEAQGHALKVGAGGAAGQRGGCGARQA
jgi:threonine dehydratase